MPFRPSFTFVYNKGDLVYGLSDARLYYIQRYSSFAQAKIFKHYRYIDGFAVTPLEMEAREYHEEKSIYYPEAEAQSEFIGFLKKNIGYHNVLIDKKGEIKTVFDKEDNTEKEKAFQHNTTVGRKCKAGLYWATHRHPFITVHFILDGLDMKNIVHKKDGNITGRELRWIYRNRHNPRVQSGIQFWMDGQPTFPPWTSDFNNIFRFHHNYDCDLVALWQKYIPLPEYMGPYFESLQWLFS